AFGLAVYTEEYQLFWNILREPLHITHHNDVVLIPCLRPREEFLDGAKRLVHGLIQIRRRRGIGVRDRDSATAPAADFAGRLPWPPVRIPQRVVFVGIA